MDKDIQGLSDRILAEYANRGLGDVELASDRALHRYSRASQDGAQNLVDKAFDALDSGDRDRARRYLVTASRLPFDDREQCHPLAWTVHMELFILVSDSAEEADERDSRWLDVAIELLSHAEQSARTEMRDVLATIDHDYRLSRTESRTLRAAIAQVPEHPSLPDQRLDQTELADRALVLVDLCRTYQQAMKHSTGGATT